MTIVSISLAMRLKLLKHSAHWAVINQQQQQPEPEQANGYAAAPASLSLSADGNDDHDRDDPPYVVFGYGSLIFRVCSSSSSSESWTRDYCTDGDACDDDDDDD